MSVMTGDSTRPVPQAQSSAADSQPARDWARGMATYLVSGEYVQPWFDELGQTYDLPTWETWLLGQCSREDLLLALTAATRVAGAGSADLDDWTQAVLSQVDPGLAGHLSRALRRQPGQLDRVAL